jgi:hypothetical protein
MFSILQWSCKLLPCTACGTPLPRCSTLPFYCLCLDNTVSASPACTDPVSQIRTSCYLLLLKTFFVFTYFTLPLPLSRWTQPHSINVGDTSRKLTYTWEEAVTKIICHCQCWMPDCVQCNQEICIIHMVLCRISNNKQTFESVKHEEM